MSFATITLEFETKTVSITSGPPTLRPGQLSAVTELSRPELNLFREAVFRSSNHVLDGHLKTTRLEGDEPGVKHKISISDEDLERC